MYPFTIKKDSAGEFTFELGDISIKVMGYTTSSDGKHQILYPEQAYAVFYSRGHVYGVANNINLFTTAEEFYENMLVQLDIVKNGGEKVLAL